MVHWEKVSDLLPHILCPYYCDNKMPVEILLSVRSEAEKKELEVGELVRRALAQGRGHGKRGRKETVRRWDKSKMERG